MTFDERCAAVATLGFTERQARFLTTVMLHTGVCVPRQYARYCRIVHGQKTRKFFAKLVRLRYASMYDCRHNRAQLYHLNQRSLYAAIGQATSRLQRPLPLSHAIHRLMVLDAIVEDPEMVWLGTTEDKTAHLTALTSIAPEGLPHVTSGIGDRRTVRYFPDRLPIGVHLAGRGVVVYVVLARAWRQGRFRRRSSPEPGWSKRSNSGIGMDISPPWSPSPRRLPGFSPLATERA